MTALDTAELRRRLPAVALIDDERLARAVLGCSAQAPEYFWNVPASAGEYHHPACREPRGLWAHTLLVATVVDELGDTYLEQGRIDADGRDEAIAAAILHDQRKYGGDDELDRSAHSNHDERMARVIRETSALPDRIADAVAAHMGPWYAGPAPETPVEDLVHTADVIASRPSITPSLPEPVPAELADLDLPSVPVDRS
ncbi:HD domain-containing protein [Halococcoides cellulosivorans]|uniref:HD domain-containing protein n=1 Tax=Halococcoides cellulosivorans TaxID=1679096 RepID=A0A2R4X1W2_9EURY|nr:HD domain-containing protein [Halococcoides cellulosivorans]AWB27790.1 hypothetical protein HARCEL1_08740 [Halococcoides cellulosivorans]